MGSLARRGLSSPSESPRLLTPHQIERPDMELTDLHCHIVPYVDDGAYTMEEAAALLRMEAEQGVRTICLTPHLRAGMFESSDEKILDQFEKLCAFVEKENLPLTLFHSREYHFDRLFRKRLEEGNVRPLGKKNYLLVEFGGRHSAQDMLSAVELVKAAGFYPLIAHVERYAPIAQDLNLASRLVEAGACLQINAGSVLGREGMKQKHLCAKLMKLDLVTAVGSDAHDTKIRRPELDACAAYLEKKIGRDYASRVLCSNPHDILI